MRNTGIKVGLFMCALFLLTTQNSQALSSDVFTLTDDPLGNKAWEVKQEKIAQKEREAAEEIKEKEAARQKEAEEAAKIESQQPQTYIVERGDNLSKIAASHNTSWQRIYAKNTQISDPDAITAGDSITIPREEEVLTERALPTPAPAVARPVASLQYSTPKQARVSYRRTQQPSSSTGNTYAAGYCTWYAKSRRPDLPNRMGNAISWVSSAAAQGFATGSTPQAGAIGQRGNHVVYVENVHGDGTVTVSEMNYKGLFIVSSRTVPASSFTYIY